MDTAIIRALCTVIGAIMYVGVFIIPIGLDVIEISLPLWLKIILIIMGGLIVVAIMIDEKMQIIEEERNGRKEKLE